MKIIEGLDQDTAEWHARRKLSIGSSDAAVIMRSDPYRTYQDLVDEKCGKISGFKSNPAIELGKKWESGARESFNILFDLDVKPVVGVNDSYPYIMASFDGLCETAQTFIEIKYIGHKKLDKVLKDKVIPPHHIIQMGHQFLVSGYQKAYYVPYALSDDQQHITRLEVIQVSPDLDFINNKLLPEEIKFHSIIECQTNQPKPR